MIFSFAGFELDDSLFELRRNREPVKVEPRVLELILYIVKHRDRVVTKQELHENVWRVETLSDWALTRCVHEARKALSDAGGGADSIIKTVHGRGYRWVADVSEEAARATTRPDGIGEPMPATEPPKAVRRWHQLVAPSILIALVLSAVIVVVAIRRRTEIATGPDEAGAWASGSLSYRQLTFGRGVISAARFTADGMNCVYGAANEGAAHEIFLKSPDGPESRPLGISGARLLSASSRGELAILLRPRYFASAHVGTLARVPIDGGGPQEILSDVESADWSPDGTALAIVRIARNGKTLELPPGRVLYQTRGWIETPRVSPRNDAVAFFDHPLGGAWHVAIVNPDGGRKVLTGGFSEGRGIAWSADGGTIWFAAGEDADSRALFRVSPSGKQELVFRAPYRLRLHDVSKDGRLLVSSESTRVGMCGFARGDARARDLSWLDFSRAADLSADGKTVLFNEEGVEGAAKWGIYIRGTDGSPARHIGDGEAMALSPDGLWALAVDRGPPDRLKLFPVGGGAPSELAIGPRLSILGEADFFPDGRSVLVEGAEDGGPMRLYVQALDGRGSPRPITPPGVTMFSGARSVSPDGKLVAGISADEVVALYPVDGGHSVPVGSFEPGEAVVRWGADGRALYVCKRTELPLRIHKLDLETGHRTLWMEINIPDPAGVDRIAPVLLARPDDKAGWKFYSKSPAGSSRNPGRGDIEFGKDSWRPVEAGKDKHMAELAQVYGEAQRVAGGGPVRTAQQTAPAAPSPAGTQKAVADVQNRIDKMASSLDLERRIMQTASSLLAGYGERIGDAMKKGYVTMGTDQNGQMKLELTRPEGMGDGEWQKIRGEFGPKLAELQGIMNREQRIIASAIESRTGDAARLYDSVKSPAYLAHLRALPPEDRAIAIAKIANSLAGSPAEKEFARDFENAYFAGGRATGPLAGIATKDLASSMNGRIALAQTALAIAPHLGATKDLAFAKAFEIITGRRPNERELSGIVKLMHADSPSTFKSLLAAGMEKTSDTSDLLGALSEALTKTQQPGVSAADEVAGAVDRKMPGISKEIEFAGGVVALFGLGYSTSELARNGASFETIGSVATDATNVFSTWASIAEKANLLDKNGFLAKSGQVLGHASNMLGLVTELHNVKQQSTDEGKYRAWVHAAASGLLVVGGLAVESTPWGAAASAVGALVNLFYGRTSDEYESMHGTLKGSLN